MVLSRYALAILAASDPAEYVHSIKDPLYITYSRNVFIPLTHVCRNACGYCIFRKEPSQNNILKKEDVYQLLYKAEAVKCTEALFTFGEKPEMYPVVLKELHAMGHTSIIEYAADLCAYTVDNTQLLPHTNAGILSEEELRLLKPVNASMGLMLESSSERLMQTTAHKLSPGKTPRLRLETLKKAGELDIPFTTGILVGIGETDLEIYQSLKSIQKIHQQYNHIQEIIIQNFIPKPHTPMEQYRPVSVSKLVNIVMLARLMFPDVSLQVPPNLNKNALDTLIKAGADDLGGISPVTPDYVNPECGWPDLDLLNREKRERLCVYPQYISKKYLSSTLYEKALSMTDEKGYVVAT
jgi:FO synthase subunit 1